MQVDGFLLGVKFLCCSPSVEHVLDENSEEFFVSSHRYSLNVCGFFRD